MKQNQTTTSVIVSLAVLGIIAFFAVHWNVDHLDDGEIEQLTSSHYEVSKLEAAKRAEDFIYAEYSLSPTETFVMLQSEIELQGYVQQSDLLDQVHDDFLQKTPFEYYSIEVETAEGPSFLVNIHPEFGTTLGWSKVSRVPEASPGGEQLARDYLQTRGHEAADWRSVPNDRAGEYVFAAPHVDIDGVELHVLVAVESGNVVTVLPEIIVPVEYINWLSGQDASAAVMSLLYLLCNVLIGVAAIVISVLYRHHISFTRGIVLTVIFLVIYIMNNFNMYPAYRTMFAGESDREAVVMFTVLLSQLFAFIMAALVYITLVAGDGLWRKMGRPLWARFRDEDYGKHIMRSVGYGYLFCLFLLGLQQVLFWIGERHFDVWSVNDPMFSTVNQLWPLLAPLLAWAAAISEEAIFRLFGIALFKRWFKSSTVAAILTSMIWAIGHTSYPIYPAYTRFIEVAIIGLVFAYIFLKFGFITAVFAHASFNSILMGISLMFTVTGPQAMLGLIYIASPVIVGCILYLLHKLMWKPAPAAPHLNG